MITTNDPFSDYNPTERPAIDSLKDLVAFVQAPFLDNTSKRHTVKAFHRLLLERENPNMDARIIDRLASTLTQQFMTKAQEEIPVASTHTIRAQIARNKRYELLAIEKGVDMLFSDRQVTDHGVASDRLLLIEQVAADYAAVVCQT